MPATSPMTPPRSMLLLRRAADAAGYANAAAPDEEPVRASLRAPAVMILTLACMSAIAFAIV